MAFMLLRLFGLDFKKLLLFGGVGYLVYKPLGRRRHLVDHLVVPRRDKATVSGGRTGDGQTC